MTEFVHLHNHTDYSLLDGAASSAKYIAKAQEYGMKALAITDHGNMFGVLDFYDNCLKAGIQPIPGCEFYINPEGRTVKDAGFHYYHLILLAMNDKGYHNLMELNSIAYTEGFYYKPRIDNEVLETHSEGLICLSACLAGEIPQKLLAGNVEGAYEVAKWYKNLFGDRYYIEIQNHFIPEEVQVLPQLAKLARDLDIPMVATNDIHYIEKSDANAHDILMCIGTGKKKSDTDRMKFDTEEFYLKSGDEMAELFSEYPEAISNTLKIAERCNFKIEFPGPILPDVDVPSEYKDTKEYLTALSWQGLRRRYPGYESDPEKKKILETRLNYELGVILKMGFDGYYLIVRDYIYWAKTHDIPVGAGRGSGAGSMVAYCVDITNVDPIKHDLLFERFLNPERVSLPDFDIDFCFEGRQTVIDYVTEHYGVNRVGQIATFGTLKAKAVVKDVARVLDIPFDESNKITKLILDALDDEAKAAHVSSLLEWSLHQSPELQEMRSRGGVYEELFDVSLRLENLARHVSTHACGVVIGKTPLLNYVPLYRDPKSGGISTQYTMNNLERCGLVKMDFLGLKTLTLIRNTIRLIHKTEPDFDIEKIPENDKETFEMMSKGDSMMVFQLESPGMQKNLKLLEPTRFEELDAMVSLYRPGPMDYIPKYIDSKQGRIPIEYPDPALEDLLKSTYGVIVYQEQVMRVSQIIAGFTLGEADTLRKIMGKKKVKEMPAQREKFIKGAMALGHSQQHAEDIFDMLMPFAKYGFNKSHSVCYTVLAYRTAYLKCHYRVEFLAANLTNEIGSGDKYKEYLDFVKNDGIQILPPSINDSDMYFNVVDGKMIYGLAGIKGVGAPTVQSILDEREANGPYKDFLDFIRRSDAKCLNSGVLEGLINAGAFDCFGYNRPTLLANFEAAIKSTKEDKDAQSMGQNLLFGGDDDDVVTFEMKVQPDYEFLEKLEIEKNYLGFYVSGHPLDTYKTAWENCVKLDLSKPERISEGPKYDFIGMVSERKEVVTKSGGKMGRLVVEDYNGRLEVTVFPKQWAMCSMGIVVGKIIGVHGSFKSFNGRMGFTADVVYGDPMQMKPDHAKRVFVEIDQSVYAGRQSIKEMRSVAKKHRGAADLVMVVYPGTDDDGKLTGRSRKVIADKSFSVDGSRELLSELIECQMVHDVYCE
ncbi:MAG: DNA polymerase III subunit alpha [Sphaerochaetaceae bacterium]|nr:DNA polymerase III subunit alpha [Sphaerochaetaceae bacterium]